MKKLIPIISLLLFFTALLSAQPTWNPVIYTNSTTLYSKVTINGIPAQAGDKVGVFVGGECRGVADVVENLGEGYVSLLIQGEVMEEASFQIWKHSNDVVYKVVNKEITLPGGTIGTPPGYFFMDGKGPDWKTVIYTNSTMLSGKVTINNISAHAGDIIGAFVNGECRGREEVIMNLDTAYVSMLIQGESVETISFRIWQASSDKELFVPKQITSEPGGTLPFTNINAINGLVAFYPFENTLTDVTKNGFDILGDGLQFVQDRFNKSNSAVAFDGVTSQAEVTNSTNLNFPKHGFTISTWVKFSDNTGTVFFGKHENGYYNGYFIASGSQLQFYVSGTHVISPDLSNDDKWHLVTGVYDGNNAVLYIDGVQKASQAIQYTAMSPNPVRLGHMQTPNYNARYKGLIDDTRIYNVPLSPEEVSALFTENNWSEQTITVVNPNGENRIKANSIYQIDWSASQYIDSVKIEFSSDDGGTWEVVAPSLPANSGSFNWRVPKISTTLGRIKISHLTSGVSAISSTPFYVDLPQVKVLTPNGGDYWEVYSPQDIKWSSTNIQNVKIDYSTDSGVTWRNITAAALASSAVYSWDVEPDTTRRALVRVSDAEDSTFFDVSDSEFTIFEPKLSLVNPVGGERYRLGTTQNISWASEYVNKVKIEFSSDNGSTWSALADSTQASSSAFTWIPNTETALAKIKISDFKNPSLYSISNAFEIFVPKLTLSSPNGGEQWRTGTSQKISWTSSDIAKVKIQYTTNDGTNWIVVADSVLASVGSFDWTIPSPATNQAKIRITDYKDVTVSSQSAAPFTIYFPTVTLTSPNGGELWQIGSQKNITWTSSYLTKVKLEYTTDGTTWKPIADQLDANLNSYLWTIPNDPTVNAKVRISDATDNLVSDTSNTVFTIYQQELTLTAPVGGERFKMGSAQTIAWASKYVNKVKIEFSQDSGNSWNTLADSVLASSGSFSWTANVETKLAKIRISDSKNSSLQSSSNVFEIFVPKLTLSSPNGGEQWRTGTSQKISWTSSDVAKVKIQYTTNDGTNWILVADSVSASIGSFDWTIPSPATNQAKIRITDYKDVTVSSQSAAPFTIYFPTVTLNSPNGGELWQIGSQKNITWTSSYLTKVKLEYTTDGIVWKPIADQLDANLNSYLWTIPNDPSTGAKVRVSDAVDNLVSFTCEGTFTIYKQVLTLTSPLGGERYKELTTQNVTWTSEYVDTVKIELSEDNGVLWAVINGAVPAKLGSHSYVASTWLTKQAKIRVSDSKNPALQSTSNAFEFYKPIITVTAPNGGQQWVVGTTQKITWTSSDITSVKIEYTTDNQIWNTIAETVTAATGSYDWTIPNSPSTNCKVRISDATDTLSLYRDLSDNVFTIILPKLTVLKPNGGESFIVGRTDTIKWTAANVANVKLEYSIDNGVNWSSIIASTPANAGSYLWTIPNNSSITCKVRISDVSNSSFNDLSDNVFSIILPKLTVLKPNGGERFIVGKTDTIKWSAANVANVKLEYSIDNGTNWNSIIASTPASAGSYLWTIPNTPSKNCKIKITDTQNPEWTDVSNFVFTIIAPVITLLSPNGGEKWLVNTGKQISWTSADIDTVRIDFSSDNGATWKVIAPKVFAWDAIYNWNVDALPTTQALIRVSQANDLTFSDLSDNTFTIYKEALVVTSPNGGEKLRAKTVVPITWNISEIANSTASKADVSNRQTIADAPIQNVKIDYSLDNGLTWNNIVSSVNAGIKSYNWQIPVAESKDCKVKVTDIADTNHTDISDGTFEIYYPKIIVTAPNGGEKWRAATTQRVEWISSEVSKVTIEYSINDGFTWKSIADSVESTLGSIEWIIPSERTTRARVRVTDISLTTTSDTSDNAFTIVVPEITVTMPSGGESWKTNTVQQIKWNSADVELLTIEYSTNSGASWQLVKDSVASSTGSFNWTVPRTPTEFAMVKLSDVNLKEIVSISKAFTIIKPLLLVAPQGGEKWFSGSVQQIKWSFNSVDSIKIEYTINDGVSWQVIANSLPTALLSYDWRIPQNIASNECRVKITDRNNFLSADSSVDLFTILHPALTLLTPNGGENLRGGTEYQILWKNQNSDSLIIDYSLDNGTTWASVTKSCDAKTEKLTWVVPKVSSPQCLIRIIDKYYATVGDTSDRVFSLYTPVITVLSPKGGETWYVGQTKEIKWASSFVDSVKIELTTDNGANWRTLTSAYNAADSVFNFFVEKTPSTNCRVKILASEDFTVVDSSRSNFAIATLPPTIQVAIYQNPVLTQYCNVVLVTDSLLSALPVTKVWRGLDTSKYEMKPIPNSANAYECSIKFDTTAVYTIASTIVSKMGVVKDTVRQFAVGMVLPNLLAKIKSKSEGLSLTVNPGVVVEKTFITIEEENVNKETIYRLQPEKTFKKAIGVELSFAGEVFEEVNKLSIFVFENGEWKPVPSEVNTKTKTVTAWLTTLAKVKLGIDANKKETIDLPKTFALMQNYPNPFNPSTMIAFNLPEDCDVSLEIYNILGAKITTLHSGFVVAGRYSVTWNGTNDANNPVPSGIYLYRIKTGKFDQVRKMILLK